MRTANWKTRAPWLPKNPEPPLTPNQEKAKHLPRPSSIVPVSIPLHLLIEWYELHGFDPDRSPCGVIEPKVQPPYGPGQCTLLVKRVESENHENK